MKGSVTDEYHRDSGGESILQHFEIRSFYFNAISASPKADPSLARFPLVMLYDNAKGNPEGRIHAVIYFHRDPGTLGEPEFRNNVIYLHYPLEMLHPLLDSLRSGMRLSCYFRRQRSERFGGIQGGPFTAAAADR